MTKPSYICFVAGRSGGHIVPAQTLVQHYKKNNPEIKIIFFSTHTIVDTSLLQHQQNIDTCIYLDLENFPHKKIHRYPTFVWQLIKAFFKSLYYLIRFRPKKIIAMGGYISIPICVVGWLLRIERELFELNVVPGKATQFLKPVINRFALCFKEAITYLPKNKCYIKQYPVRFSQATKNIPKKEALATMTFLSSRKTIMILGGSQGSAFINNIIKQWIEENPSLHNQIQIIHQTGLLHDKFELDDFYAKYAIPAFVFDYYHELEYCYQAADIIVCRSGAGTLFEVNFFEKPCITIPLETPSTRHQYYNALSMTHKKPDIFTLITQKELQTNTRLLGDKINSHLLKQK